MSRPRAYQLMESASVKDVLSPIGDIQPANEAQTRPLAKLETVEAQQEAWEMVVETAFVKGRTDHPGQPFPGEGIHESPLSGEDTRPVARWPLPVQLTPFSPAA